jgi:hypothetical protein
MYIHTYIFRYTSRTVGITTAKMPRFAQTSSNSCRCLLLPPIGSLLLPPICLLYAPIDVLKQLQVPPAASLFVRVRVWLSVSVSVFVSVFVPVSVSVFVSVFVPVSVSVFVSVFVPVSVSVSVFVSVSVSVSVCACIILPLPLSIYMHGGSHKRAEAARATSCCRFIYTCNLTYVSFFFCFFLKTKNNPKTESFLKTILKKGAPVKGAEYHVDLAESPYVSCPDR